jgi:hypothetical protein
LPIGFPEPFQRFTFRVAIPKPLKRFGH